MCVRCVYLRLIINISSPPRAPPSFFRDFVFSRLCNSYIEISRILCSRWAIRQVVLSYIIIDIGLIRKLNPIIMLYCCFAYDWNSDFTE